MAIAKICDRCAGVYANDEVHADFGDNKFGTIKGVCVMFKEASKDSVQRTFEPPHRNAYLDLCPACSEMLRLFLTDGRTTVERRTY